MRILRLVYCVLIPLIALIVVCHSLQNSVSESVVKAEEPITIAAVITVEAESCFWGQEEDCQTEGAWKTWQDSVEFSNEWLVTNEHETEPGKPVPVTLTLSFSGTGFSIVYRQDTWYGTLGVEVDDRSEYCVNQQGSIENQAEACFEVESGPHTLSVSGGEPTGIITGVISLDAIKIFDEDEPCGAEESLCDRGIIVPAYFYPDLPDGYWGQLVEAAKRIDGRLIVIANVDNGPGTITDTNYTEAITAVVSNGGNVIGYVHTCYLEPDPIDSVCPRSMDSIKADIDNWYAFYEGAGLGGIFFDQVSIEPGKVLTYQNLYTYVRDIQPGAIVVNNFGTKPPEDYFGIGSSILCTFENDFSYFAVGWLPPKCVGWSPPGWITRDRSCVLVYNTSSDDLPTGLEHLSKEEIGWFYFTSDTIAGDDNPWDTLPSYFPGLVDRVSCVCYLPIILKESQ